MSESLALLVLRVGVGVQLAALHGWDKIANFSAMKDTFLDPLGIGSPISLCLAIVGQFVCVVAVGLGLFTRLTAIPIVATMGVAVFVHHANDPWDKKELALMYMIAYLAITLLGPGNYSIDRRLQLRKQKAKKA